MNPVMLLQTRKVRKIPCRHDLEQFIHDYMAAAGIALEKGTPLFRSMDRRRQLTDKALHRVDASAMLNRTSNRAY